MFSFLIDNETTCSASADDAVRFATAFQHYHRVKTPGQNPMLLSQLDFPFLEGTFHTFLSKHEDNFF